MTKKERTKDCIKHVEEKDNRVAEAYLLKRSEQLMKSTDYKKRFIGEYLQTKVRYSRLHRMLVLYDAKKLDFTFKSPIRILRKQAKAMGDYLYCLEVRAKAEEIDLENI